MPLEKISRTNQIIIYVVILILAVIFVFYFFKQALITQADLSDTTVMSAQPSLKINNATVKINLDLLGTDKFLNLRSEVTPVQSFKSGKRNPFQSQ
jgi:hypothetical protein